MSRLDRAKYFPGVVPGAVPGGTWLAGCGTWDRHGRLGAACSVPARRAAQQMDGISSANKQPWPRAQRTRLFLTAAGEQLPQRINKPLNGDWRWETAVGEQAGGRVFACELGEAGKTASAPGSVLSAGACCAEGHS